MKSKSKKYVDGYVLPVPKNKLAAYRKMAQQGGKLWRKHGALQYFECVGDDLAPNMGGMKIATFPQAAKAKPNEAVIFSFVIFKSRAHRNQVNKRVMADPAMSAENFKDKPMPFEMKKMVYGGFKVMVEE